MELWTYWLSVIQSLLIFLSSQIGLGTGMAIVALTLLLRTLILPLSWRVAYRGTVRQKKILRLQPELAKLKAECGDEPQVYATRMLKLHQQHGIAIMDWRGVLGSLLQMPLFLGMYQTLRDLPEQMRLILILVPSILAAIAALKFCSALAVYWTVSNSYSALQTGVLHYVVARRIKSGALSI